MKFNDKQSEQQVLEKATGLLFRYGIKGWNMDQLAAESGLAKNTLYRIIGSKEQLIQRVLLNYCRQGHIRVVAIIDKGGNYIDTLEAILEDFPEHMNSLYTDSLQEVFLEYPGIEKLVREHRDEMSIRITDFIRRGINEGYFREEVQAESVFELLQAIILFFMKSGLSGAELSNKIRDGFRSLLYGLVPSKPKTIN